MPATWCLIRQSCPGKYEYFAQPDSYSRSGALEFLTEDPERLRDLGYVEGRNLTTDYYFVSDLVATDPELDQ